MIALREQLACCHREVALRRKCYPKWVNAGDMDQASASRELERMVAVTQTITVVMEIDEALRQEDLFDSREDRVAGLIEKLIGLPPSKD